MAEYQKTANTNLEKFGRPGRVDELTAFLARLSTGSQNIVLSMRIRSVEELAEKEKSIINVPCCTVENAGEIRQVLEAWTIAGLLCNSL